MIKPKLLPWAVTICGRSFQRLLIELLSSSHFISNKGL